MSKTGKIILISSVFVVVLIGGVMVAKAMKTDGVDSVMPKATVEDVKSTIQKVFIASEFNGELQIRNEIRRFFVGSENLNAISTLKQADIDFLNKIFTDTLSGKSISSSDINKLNSIADSLDY